MVRFKSGFLIAVVFVACTSCELSKSDVNRTKWDPWPQPPPPDVELQLEIPDNIQMIEESVVLRLHVRNIQDDTLRLVMDGIPATDTYYYEFVITDLDSTVIWNRLPEILVSGGNGFIMQPGDMHTFSHTWNFEGNDGKRVATGTYLVWGGLSGLWQVNKETGLDEEGIATRPDTVNIY